MAKIQAPQILTANRLRNGETVYYTHTGDWSPHVAEARVAHTPEEIDALKGVGAQAYAANLVIDVNMIDVVPVVESPSPPQPAHIREIIRSTGPTVRRDLNKPVSPG